MKGKRNSANPLHHKVNPQEISHTHRSQWASWVGYFCYIKNISSRHVVRTDFSKNQNKHLPSELQLEPTSIMALAKNGKKLRPSDPAWPFPVGSCGGPRASHWTLAPVTAEKPWQELSFNAVVQEESQDPLGIGVAQSIALAQLG